jgi:hypothetical protein
MEKITYPWPGEPQWARHPYADADACYGCGLSPEKGNLCFWCDELRRVIKQRARFPMWII